MGLRLDVVRDEARPLFRGNPMRRGNRTRVIGVIGVERCEDGARVPEDAARHWSRIACLSRAPGLRPAPTSRNIGWSRRKGGICCLCLRRVSVWRAVAGTRRRPPRWSSRWGSRWHDGCSAARLVGSTAKSSIATRQAHARPRRRRPNHRSCLVGASPRTPRGRYAGTPKAPKVDHSAAAGRARARPGRSRPAPTSTTILVSDRTTA